MTPTGPSIYLLGGIQLDGVPPGTANALLAQSKVTGLLAILLLSPRSVAQRRDRLVGLLWPELDQPHARMALRKAVHEVRAVLGEAAIVSRGDEELLLAPDALWCDAVELRVTVGRGHFARAVELYRGDLMPGFHLAECHDFDSWLEDRRTELHDDAIRACMDLAKLLETENATEAANYARKAARLAGFNERVVRRVLTMLDRLGDRAGALRLYDEFARRLRREMEADPSPETVRLGDALRAGRPLA